MKRLSLREVVLLCSPLLIIAVVGFLLSRRRPSSEKENLQLNLQIEKPTALEAFQGTTMVMVVNLKGRDADNFTYLQPSIFLELKANKKTQISRPDSCSGEWCDVWMGSKDTAQGTRIYLNTRPVPPGRLRFGADVGLAFTPKNAVPVFSKRHLKGMRTIERSQINPFNFEQSPRSPLVVLRSVKITGVDRGRVGTPDSVTGICSFDLVGPGMNAQTPVEFGFSGGGFTGGTFAPTGSMWGAANPDPKAPLRRLCKWAVFARPTPKPSKSSGYVSGHLSADSRWPLAFQAEPFDFATAIVGQSLKFKSWPMPRPKP